MLDGMFDVRLLYKIKRGDSVAGCAVLYYPSVESVKVSLLITQCGEAFIVTSFRSRVTERDREAVCGTDADIVIALLGRVAPVQCLCQGGRQRGSMKHSGNVSTHQGCVLCELVILFFPINIKTALIYWNLLRAVQ